MKIAVDMGHSLSGAGSGAIGIKSETDMNRLVGKRLIQMLQEKNHTVINCTVDYAPSQNDQLAGIVQKANAQAVDCFVSLHLNSYKDASANGVETFVYTGCNKTVAKRVNDELANKVGWFNRGVKEANYYVLKYTKAPAILVELGFCSNSKDMNLWNTEVIAKALFKGITGAEYQSSSSATQNNSASLLGTYKVTADVLNVRKKANVNSPVVAQIKKGEVYTITDITNGWGKLKSGVGYVSMSYMQKC